jgi:hypothetical protein
MHVYLIRSAANSHDLAFGNNAGRATTRRATGRGRAPTVISPCGGCPSQSGAGGGTPAPNELGLRWGNGGADRAPKHMGLPPGGIAAVLIRPDYYCPHAPIIATGCTRDHSEGG